MKSFITTEWRIHCHMNQQKILLPLWSHSIHGLLCTNSTVQSDVSFMLGCEHKNLLTFTVGCCVEEINVKHTHTHTCSIHVWNEEMNSNSVRYVSFYKIRQIHLEDIRWSGGSLCPENVWNYVNEHILFGYHNRAFHTWNKVSRIYHSHCS